MMLFLLTIKEREVRFFFGTPQRFLGSLAGIGFIVCLVDPTIFAQALDQMIGILGMAFQHAIRAIVTAISPALGPALTLLVVFAGIRLILFGRGGGGRRN